MPILLPQPQPQPLSTEQLKEPLIEEGRKAKTSWLKVVGVVSFYIVASITMIMVNKSVLRQTGLPITFLWGQLFIAVLLLRLLSLVNIIALPPVNVGISKAMLPLTVANVVGLTLNTFCLLHIDAVLYQVARSLILPLTVLLTPLILKQRVSLKVALSCGIVFLGFVVGLFGDLLFSQKRAALEVSRLGIIFALLSCLSSALHSFIIKRSFSSVPNSGAFDLVYYNNLYSSLLLFPFLFIELSSLLKLDWSEWRFFLIGVLVAGASGLLINLAGFLQIKVTSPVTHTVSSAARGVLQSLAAYLLLNELITVSRCAGILITLIGSALYSLAKSQEHKKS